jgi:hypothetical protein
VIQEGSDVSSVETNVAATKRLALAWPREMKIFLSGREPVGTLNIEDKHGQV